jgi:hypothetical protein
LADYYGDLMDMVDSFADWNDPRQACIMVGAASSDDSAFASKISNHARVTMPCLIARLKGIQFGGRPLKLLHRFKGERVRISLEPPIHTELRPKVGAGRRGPSR